LLLFFSYVLFDNWSIGVWRELSSLSLQILLFHRYALLWQLQCYCILIVIYFCYLSALLRHRDIVITITVVRQSRRSYCHVTVSSFMFTFDKNYYICLQSTSKFGVWRGPNQLLNRPSCAVHHRCLNVSLFCRGVPE